MKIYNTPVIVCINLTVRDIIAASNDAGEGNTLYFNNGTKVDIEDYFS